MPRKSAKKAVKDTKNDLKPSASSTAISRKRVIPTTYEWYFLDVNNNWIKYGYKDSSREGTNASILSDDIEKAYLANEFGSLNFYTQKYHYILKFDTMEQMNVTNKKVRPVHRRPVKKRGGRRPAAKVGNLPSPPCKCIVNHIAIESVIEIFKVLAELWKKLNDKATKKIIEAQKAIGNLEVQPQQATTFWIMPSLWDPMKDDETMVLVPLESSSKEYNDVISQFSLVSVTANTVIIKRVQNPYLFIPYQIRQKELSIRYGAGTQLNVQKLFHGTKEEHVISICKENFDWRLHGANGRESFGMGTYFSNSARISRDYSLPNVDGHCFMFLADVIVGTIAQGDSSMTRPPKHPITGESYDTTVDNVVAPQKFVKYDKQDYYPLYVIEFW